VQVGLGLVRLLQSTFVDFELNNIRNVDCLAGFKGPISGCLQLLEILEILNLLVLV